MTAQQYFEKLRAECGNDSAKMDQTAKCLDMLCQERPDLAPIYAETAILLRTHAGTLRCDFCSTACAVLTRLSCQSKVLSAKGIAFGYSYQDWGACEICAGLVDADDREALAGRAADGMSNTAGLPREFWLEMAREMHATAFFACRSEEFAA